MPQNRAAEAALLKWVNTFPLESKVESFGDLCDGFVLSRMLEDIDPAYSAKDFEQSIGPQTWPSKKKSLEAIYKSLVRYIRNNCEDLDTIVLEESIDFNAIAQQIDIAQTETLLTIFLMAAVKGTSNTKYVGIITEQLDAMTQAEIASIIQQMDKPINPQPSSSKAVKPTPNRSMVKDSELALEEERASHEALKKKHADFITRFERLQESHDELLEHSNETDRQLRALRNSADDSLMDYIKDLKGQLQEANDLIASQEQQAESDRVIKDKYYREIASLRPSTEKLTDLEDQIKELKTENQALSRKANTLDHFQKKLELQSGIEKENSNLRRRIDTLEENQKEFDKVHEENTKLKLTVEEYQRRFNSYELQVVELGTQKKVLENDLRRQQTDLDIIRGTKQHDDEFIRDLQEQVRIGVASPLPLNSPMDQPRALTLEEELERSDKSVSNHALEISRLRAENQFLKANLGGTTNATLRTDIEVWVRKCKRLEEKYQELFEKHTVEQEQLQAIISTSTNEKDDALINTRRLYLESNQELQVTRSKLAEAEAELSSKSREVLAVRADLNAVSSVDVDALTDLKATHELITSSINGDLLLAQGKLKELTTDFEQQKSHFIAALLVKDRLQQQLAIMQEQRPQLPPTGEPERREQYEAKWRVEEESLIIARQTDKERIETQEALIEDLKGRLKAAEEGGAVAQIDAHDYLMTNLVRENNMMATAWYDLTNRLQSNHVVLQRKQDAPRSWLGKQRQTVTTTARR